MRRGARRAGEGGERRNILVATCGVVRLEKGGSPNRPYKKRGPRGDHGSPLGAQAARPLAFLWG
jgi:hypothetical protein